MKVGASYVRVSTTEQAQGGFSLESQLKDIRRFAVSNDIDIQYNFADEGHTAFEGAINMPSFQKMVALAEGKDCPFNHVIVWDHSRFARDAKDALHYKGKLQQLGIKVLFVNNSQNRDDPTSNLLDHIMFGMAEFDSAWKAVKVASNMNEGATQGYVMGGADPYGLTKMTVYNEKGKPKKKYTPNQTEAHVVKLIYQLYADGYSLDRIVRNLHERGISPRTGNRWSKAMLSNILWWNQEKYLGNYVYGRKCKRKKHPRGLRNKDEWIITRNTHEAIITQDLANSVNLARGMRKSFEDRVIDPLLLGKITCGICGNPVTTAHGMYKDSHYHYYVCSKYRRAWRRGEKESCPLPWFRLERIEEIVLKEIEKIYLKPGNLEKLIDATKQRWRTEHANSGDRRGSLEKNRKSLLSKKNRLLDAIENGIVTNEDARSRMENIRTQLEQVESELETLQERDESDLNVNIEGVKQLVCELLDSPDGQQHLINMQIKQIVFFPRSLDITFNFPPDHTKSIPFRSK